MFLSVICPLMHCPFTRTYLVQWDTVLTWELVNAVEAKQTTAECATVSTLSNTEHTSSTFFSHVPHSDLHTKDGKVRNLLLFYIYKYRGTLTTL